MAAWSDVGLVAVSGGLGFAASYLTTWLQRRYTREDREAAKQAARVERVAQVMGPIMTLLIDLLPARASFNNTSASIGESRVNRWLPLRDELSTIAAMEPSTEVRDAMASLEIAIESLYNRLFVALDPKMADAKVWEAATFHHEQAANYARAVLASLHAQDNTGATSAAELPPLVE